MPARSTLPERRWCRWKITIHRRADYFCPEAGWTWSSVPEVCRKLGISDASFYTWRKKYRGISPSELKHIRQLEEENLRLKKLVAGLSLDKAMRMCRKNWRRSVCTHGAGTCWWKLLNSYLKPTRSWGYLVLRVPPFRRGVGRQIY